MEDEMILGGCPHWSVDGISCGVCGEPVPEENKSVYGEVTRELLRSLGTVMSEAGRTPSEENKSDSTKYRKKPVVIEAVRFRHSAISQKRAKKFVGDKWIDRQFLTHEHITNPKIKTVEGEMEVNCGDYIIKGVHGEFYPCKPDVFEKNYEKV